MKRSPLVSTSCIASILLANSLALADPPPVAVTLEHEGAAGVWLPENMAREILADAEELRVRRSELDVCYRKSEVQSERIKTLTNMHDAAKATADAASEQLDRAVRGREQAERDKDGWLAGKPWLWWLIGGAVGAVVTAVVVVKVTD